MRSLALAPALLAVISAAALATTPTQDQTDQPKRADEPGTQPISITGCVAGQSLVPSTDNSLDPAGHWLADYDGAFQLRGSSAIKAQLKEHAP